VFDVFDESVVPSLGDASPQLVEKVVEPKSFRVVENTELLPDVLRRVIESLISHIIGIEF